MKIAPLASLLATLIASPALTPASAQTVTGSGVEFGLRVGEPAASLDAAVRHVALDADRHGAVHHDVAANGTLRARGRSYKASANEEGFTFTPFLGSDAPRNYPTRFELSSVTVGGEALPFHGTPAVSRAGDRVTLDRGAVRVRYDLSPAGAEQSFEIPALPGSGELVLSIGVATELDVDPQGAGFLFSNERGGFGYGAAVAFDASGKSTDVPAAWSGDTLRLTVPAAFLAGATAPIVIDPIMTPFAVGTSTADLDRPDAAYSEELERFSVVAEEVFSATDVDVYTWYVGVDGTVSGGAYVDQSSDSWVGPRVGVYARPFSDTVIVATAASQAIPGSTDVAVRIRRGDGSFRAPAVLQSATSAYGCAAPDVGTDRYIGYISYIVVYQRVYPSHRDIHSMSVNTETVLGDMAVAANAALDMSPPVIAATSSFAGGSLYYPVTWTERDLATGASSVRAALHFYEISSSTGNQLLFGPFTVAGPSTTSLFFDVDVSIESRVENAAGTEGVYLVTYDDRPSNDTDAFVAVCQHTSVLGTYELQVSEHASRTPNQNSLRVISEAQRFVLGYEEGGRLLATSTGIVGEEPALVERRRVALGSNMAPGTLATADRTADGGGLFVWTSPGVTNSTIAGAVFTRPVPNDAPAGSQYCYGTENSTGDRGFIRATGSRVVGAAHELHVEALPAQVFGYYLASRTTGHVPNAAGSQGTLCVGGSVGRFGIYQANGQGESFLVLDTQQLAQPQGPVSAAAGERWHFQSWYRDSVGGAATSNFTNAVTIPFR